MLALAVLVALFHVVEDTRGKRAWEQHKRECAARGEDIGDWQSLIPPPIPDEDNVAMAPIFQDLLAKPARRWVHLPSPQRITPHTNTVSGTRWQTGVNYGLDHWRVALSNDNLLVALAFWDDDLREIEEALKRPLFRHEEWDKMPADFFPNVVIAVGESLTRIYHLWSMARLEEGQTSDALEDIKTGFRVANMDLSAPLTIAVIVRSSFLDMMLVPVWAGIHGQAWDAQQLAELQGVLEDINLVEHLVRANKFDTRWCANLLISAPRPKILDQIKILASFSSSTDAETREFLAGIMPRGWFYQNALHYARLYDNINAAIHADDRWLDIPQIKRIYTANEESEWTAYSFLVGTFQSMGFSYVKKPANTQATLHQAVIACAIERYRLEHGRIPERLGDLVPTYLAKIPSDPCDGQPMRYKPEGDGNAVIYSIGINGVDDGGQFGVKKMKGADVVDIDSGDWIWRVITSGE